MDKGKGKMPEYEVDHPNESASDVSACSLDNEFGVGIMQTPGAKKAINSANKNSDAHLERRTSSLGSAITSIWPTIMPSRLWKQTNKSPKAL